MDDVVSLYETYVNEFRRLEQAKNPWQGALGFGGKSSDFPCHEEFCHSLRQLLDRLAQDSTTPGQAREILYYIYFNAPVRWEEESAVYWVMLTVHGFTAGLARLLDAESAAALHSEYLRVYPKNRRLPVQNDIVSQLFKISRIA